MQACMLKFLLLSCYIDESLHATDEMATIMGMKACGRPCFLLFRFTLNERHVRFLSAPLSLTSKLLCGSLLCKGFRVLLFHI